MLHNPGKQFNLAPLSSGTRNGEYYRQTSTDREALVVTAVLQKWRCSASYDSEVVNQSLVLRINICGENRHLLVAAKR